MLYGISGSVLNYTFGLSVLLVLLSFLVFSPLSMYAVYIRSFVAPILFIILGYTVSHMTPCGI